MKPGFKALLWTQALGAYNDNAFKTVVALWAVSALDPGQSSRIIALSGALFVLPFILFSSPAGALADRLPKKRLIVGLKAVEVVLMAGTFFALYTINLPLLIVLLVLMGAQSAFFGPVKLAILPEILERKDLSHGNGLMQMSTFLAILLGTATAGVVVGRFSGMIYLSSALFTAVAGAGLWASLKVEDVPAAGGTETLRWNAVGHFLDNLAELRGHRGVFLALMGTAYFWFVGAMLQMNLLVYGKQLMGLDEVWLSVFQIAVAVGIGAGSYASGRLSRGKVELGLVPFGAFGLVLFSADLAFSFRSAPRTFADLFLWGVSAGCFVVPLQAFVQLRSPDAVRGKFIAAGNVLSFTGVFIASAGLWAFSGFFHLHPGQIFLVVAVMTAAVAAYIAAMLPDFLLRLVFYPIANLIYSIEVEGADNVPQEGPAFLIANHLSQVDAFLISAATSRLIRFLMFRSYYDHPVLNPVVRIMRCIPISETDSPRALLKSFMTAREALVQGDIVCIFAEGEISRHGQMLRFKKGFERIVKGLEVPVIPVHLDRVWGSIFSFERGKFIFKKPRRIPYPVTVSFGKPMTSSSTAFQVRRSILELGSLAFRHRLADKDCLPLAFLKEAKRHPLRFAMADSTGRRLNYAQALVGARLLGREISRAAGPCEAVGLLLPSTVAGALANLGAALEGLITVNLNYTASPEVVEACAAKARVGAVITSKRFLEKLGWPRSARMVFIEDILGGIGPLRSVLTAAGLLVLPSFLAERFLVPKARKPLGETATIIFTSGSTGTPKGVMLTHANIQSNIEAMGQIYQVDEKDRVLGVLPFFHSFGHLATLWFPLIGGFGVVYHFNPLDPRVIGNLAEAYGATFLLGTPTFLSSYLRRIPAGKFKSLRFVVVGAEKLREETARAFEEKFGLLPLEGYGATELSPAAAINIPDFKKSGGVQKGMKLGTVGHPIPGVLMKVVDPESGAELPPGEPGLLLVKGPNVMKGYLDEPELTASVLRDGYYTTGDIAAIDEDGFVTITDRLSRFSKIAGEMVPHIKIEETLQRLSGAEERVFVVTGAPDEKKGERLVVLHTPLAGLDELYAKLRREGLPNLWVPSRDSFFEIPEIPLLGSGKADMAELKRISKERTASS